MSRTIADQAREYVERFGIHIVPIEPKRKFPRSNDWGHNVICDPDHAQSYYESNPDWNLGAALGPSEYCSLDIDCIESFGHICDCFGIDLHDLIAETPTIQGASKGMRLMFRVPPGAELPYRKLNWKRDDDEARSYTVFELRAATDGKQRQDVLPPSVHPDTGLPYQWLTEPMDDWPTPPRWLLAMWTDFERFKPQMQEMCPWAEKAPEPACKPKKTSQQDGSVIDAFLQHADLLSTLSKYGYKQRGKRWLSPHSSTGLPGVKVFESGTSCWIHHASDPLCSQDSGRPVNAFDLFAEYEYRGNLKEATKAAAKMLGMYKEPGQIRQEQAQKLEQSKSAPTDSPMPSGRASYNLIDPLPFSTDKGKPLRHIENLKEICARIGVIVRYNMIAKEEEIIIPRQSFSVDNMGNASLAWLKSECSLFDFPTDQLDGMVTYLADQNQYNPVAQWVTSRPWDGVSRLQSWYDTVTGAQDHVERKRLFKETLMRRWGVSAIAAAFSPNGISAAGVLTFQGAQHIGKTKWFKGLAPAELNLIKDGMILRPDDKDSVKQCVSFWLVELGELDATFRKSDIAALKSFLTNDSDVLRRAYARKESKYARRTVFFASVNPKEFLHDPTGNRRYWTIEAVKLDHSHTVDMQQVWAELYELWKAGESYYLTHDEIEMLNEHNDNYTTVDPIEDRLLTRLDWDSEPIEWRWATATDILLDIGVDRPTRGDSTTCAALVRKRNGNMGRRSSGKTVLYAPRRITPLP